jgi:tape measure domain-containing protein
VSDFQVKVGGDFSELLRGFQQLEQRAKTAGDNVGKGIGDGIQGFSSKSLAALNQELNRLQQRQLKVAVDSSEFTKAGLQIKEVQGLINAVQRQQVLIQVDDRSITALQTKLADLQSRQVKVDVDSQEFIELQRQINATEKELQEISQRKVLIDADANSFLAITAKLRNELNSLQERQLKIDVDSQEFVALGKEIDRVEGELQALERKRTAVTIDASSIEALQAKLTDLQTRQTKVSVDSQEFADLQVQINNVQRDLAEVEQNKILINVDGNSITALTTKLKAELTALEQRRVTIDVDSQEFIEVSQQIDRVEGELQALERKKLLINADPSSIIALRSRLGELQGELEKTQIGSQRFRDLQNEIQKTEAEITKATQSSRKFSDILKADIGGGIFGQLAGLASAGTVVAFLKSSVDEAVKLETITRKLSNTLGSQGAAGALTFTRQLSDELGLSFNTLTDTFGGFTAAATAAGVPMQQQRDLFAAVSKSAQSLGLSNDELSGSLLALQQVASKGVVQMEELRGQLGERLPVAFGATAKGLGLTQQELIKLVESGGLRAEQFFAGLTKGLNELNSGPGGVPTAAQNFQRLSNAWTDLQASFGTSLLPTITKTVNALAGALEGLEVSVAARELRESFGVTADEATALVGTLKAVQEQYGLTVQQSKNLLSNAIANTGASRDWFGELNLGGERFGKVQENLIDLAIKYRDANPDAAANRREEEIAMAKVQEALKAAALVDEARKSQALELAKIYGQQQVEALNGQISVGQQLVGLSQALADQEQSRFAVVKAGLEFELSKAQERGASEQQIGDIKARIQELDRQSLQSRYQALLQQQQLETKLLELAQAKARTEADLSVAQARVDLLKAEAGLSKAKNDQEKIAAETQIQVQEQILSIRQEQIGVLAQTQPLERQIAAATAETARNGLQAQAAQAGFNIEADGSVTKTAALAAETSKVKQAAEARKKVEQEIGEVIKQSSLRLATEQLSVAEKLVSLSRALATEEQSRFDLVRSNLEYELKKAEERGASESEIGSIKERIQQVDRAAAEARYAALLQQQQLEAKMLEIAQRKQVLEANVEFRKQQLALLEAQKKLQEAIAAGDQGAIALARSQVGLQQVMLGVRGEQLGLLAQTQPLEAQILAAQQSAAINAERARAAQNGYQLAAAQSAVNLGNLASVAGGLNTLTAGYAQNLGAAATQAGQLEGAVSDAQSPADGIASAFVTTGDRAPAAAQGARDFAAWLSQAKVFAERIAGLAIDAQMANVARSTAQAAGAAKVFYDWLERASRLPGSRWTGGPVEAGEQYRINELGQESLLSGGRLSLINAAPNSLWRAPANGTVIPAGITSRLQDQGALPSRPGTTPIMTSGSSNAALAVEVGKLRQEVGELARKQWNVNVAMKTGPTGSQVIRQMMR